MSLTGDQVARLCENLAEVRAEARDAGEEKALDSLLHRVRGGEDVGEPLRDFLRRLGVPESPPLRGPWGVLGRTGDHPAQDVFVCPVRLCSRLAVPTPGASPLACRIQGVPLRRERV